MIRKTFPVGMLQCNCTILGDEKTGEAIVIDPGDEAPRIIKELTAQNLRVKAIIHTHAHFDHIGGTAELARVTGAPTYLHPDDTFLHEMLPMQAKLFGVRKPLEQAAIDLPLNDDLVLSFGAYELAVLHTPGHTPGSVCFHVPTAELCLSGDTLFAGGVGRTDLWGGDGELIQKSIRNRLYSLHGAVEVVPGHGPLTTIDKERTSNPFVRL